MIYSQNNMPDFSFESYLNCQDVSRIERVIESDATRFNEWYTSGHDNIRSQKMPIRQFVSVKGNLLAKLDFHKPLNRAFIIQLHDVCCALLLSSPATILYHIIRENKLLPGSRLEAAMMFLCSYGSNEEYVKAFFPICEKLDLAIRDEDDDEWPGLSVFIRYYAKTIRDLPQQYIADFRNLIQQNKNRFAFLQMAPIEQALAIPTADTESAYTKILSVISSIPTKFFLDKSEIVGNDIPCIVKTPQSQSEYETRLASCGRNFSKIRLLSYDMTKDIENCDAVYNSLGRGIRVLTAEEQLIVYMKAYGLMHEAKLKSAFEHFPFEKIGEELNVVDWGCGQAIATMVLLEYLQTHFPSIRVRNVLLIEPSAIAIERAKIHVLHYDNTIQIKTINKGFDAITPEEVSMPCDVPVLHLFSNILDYEGYMLSHLEKIVDSCSTGENYFICASPHINEIKTARLDLFEHYFSNQEGYQHFYDVENEAGTWQNNWTRVLRIFGVD